MDSIKDIFTSICTFVVTPATLLGGAGGMFSGVTKHKSFGRCVLETASGAVVANVTFPLISAYCPEAWHYTLFFFSGVGGLKMVESLADAASDHAFLQALLRLWLDRLGRK